MKLSEACFNLAELVRTAEEAAKAYNNNFTAADEGSNAENEAFVHLRCRVVDALMALARFQAIAQQCDFPFAAPVSDDFNDIMCEEPDHTRMWNFANGLLGHVYDEERAREASRRRAGKKHSRKPKARKRKNRPLKRAA